MQREHAPQRLAFEVTVVLRCPLVQDFSLISIDMAFEALLHVAHEVRVRVFVRGPLRCVLRYDAVGRHGSVLVLRQLRREKHRAARSPLHLRRLRQVRDRANLTCRSGRGSRTRVASWHHASIDRGQLVVLAERVPQRRGNSGRGRGRELPLERKLSHALPPPPRACDPLHSCQRGRRLCISCRGVELERHKHPAHLVARSAPLRRG